MSLPLSHQIIAYTSINDKQLLQAKLFFAKATIDCFKKKYIYIYTYRNQPAAKPPDVCQRRGCHGEYPPSVGNSWRLSLDPVWPRIYPSLRSRNLLVKAEKKKPRPIKFPIAQKDAHLQKESFEEIWAVWIFQQSDNRLMDPLTTAAFHKTWSQSEQVRRSAQSPSRQRAAV